MMIEIKNLTKKYVGDTYNITALDNVNLKIADGEFVAVMGASGSGKTTLLNCIGLIEEYDSGDIIIDGTDLKGKSRKEQSLIRKDKISFVFQHFELMANFTVYENLEIPLLAQNIKKSQRKKIIREKTKIFNLEDVLKKYPRQLSGGQQQRIAIIRAIVSDNPYILADEPTGALDRQNTIELLSILKELNKNGKTIIMVTHDKEVADYADRIIHLADGCIIEQ